VVPWLLAALLAAGAPLDREGRLRGGAVERVEVECRAGDLLQGVLEQRGIDVVVRVLDPSGQERLEVDSPNGTEGPEPILLVAAAAGRHTLELRALDPAAAEGAYRLHVDVPRPATPNDRDLAAAFQDWTIAWKERGVGLAGAPGAHAHYLRAREAGERALQAWRRLLGPRDPKVADALDVLGYIHDELGDYGPGLRAFEESLAIREAAAEKGSRLVETRSDLAFLHLMSGDPAGAQRLFEQVLAADPRRSAARQGLADARHDRGDLARARELAVVLRDEAVAAGGDPTTSEVRLARLDLALGRREDAEAGLRRIEGRLPAPPAAVRIGRAPALEVLAEGALARGDLEAAAGHVARARAARVAAFGEDHPALVRTLTIEGRLRAARGDLAGAATVLTEAVRLGDRRLGRDHLGLAPALDALAAVESRRGRKDAAAAAWTRSISIRERAALPTHPALAQARAALAALRAEGG
jgi:tetratricopeptide (TPR) repeat protein